MTECIPGFSFQPDLWYDQDKGQGIIRFFKVNRRGGLYMTIKELRLSKNLTQTQLAALIGVNKSTVGSLENGRMKISDRIADKIWEVFGTEVTDENAPKPVKKASAPKLEIYIQSPLGGNITPEEVAAKMPEGAEACFVRVDQNKIWWVRGDGETGFEWIWE